VSDYDTGIETPTEFYLGNEYDLVTRKARLDLPAVMYDHRHLLTHGVIVGMTGSGKTALSICLLEEAAIDSIPCIILDVKGDLCNLLLQFPELDPKDFQHWMNADDAQRRGETPEVFAKGLADRWRQGLEETRQSAERIKLLKDSAEWLIYTPGSDAGLPLSVLKTFSAPKGKMAREDLNQKIDATTSALLGLTGISSDPIQSREHILIAQLLKAAWENDEDLDLKTLIRRIQNPYEYVETIGAFPVDEFYPEKERLKLALALNNILASPSFSTWTEGEPIDFDEMLYTPPDATGKKKPRHLIFYLAHLEDTQKMFFLTLLLDEVLTWTRRQSGTTGLRALLYFDEVYGFIPPHPANPPTKLPLMMLLKQARAFGVSIVLATQNPVDLDYKAISNAGTWMIGKLQTERGKARLLEGLEGVAAERGTLTDRAYLESVISALGSRVFLVHNVHKSKPFLMQTRFALSFLRGPMTRDQVAELMEPYKQARKGKKTKVALAPKSEPANQQANEDFKESIRRSAAPTTVETSGPPSLPSDMTVFYLPVKQAPTPLGSNPDPFLSNIKLEKSAPQPTSSIGGNHPQPVSRKLVYQPRLLGIAEVNFLDKKRALDLRRVYRFLVEVPAPGFPISWTHEASIPDPTGESLARDAEWSEVPADWNSSKKLTTIKKDLAEQLYRDAKFSLYQNDELELISQPGEEILSFLNTCKAVATRNGDAELTKERDKFTTKERDLRSKVPAEALAPPVIVDKTFSLADIPLLGRFFGSKSPPPPAPLSKKTGEKVTEVKQKLADLQAEWERKQLAIRAKWEEIAGQYTELLLKPRKSDVTVTHFGLAWAPFWQNTYADGTAARVPAYV